MNWETFAIVHKLWVEQVRRVWGCGAAGWGVRGAAVLRGWVRCACWKAGAVCLPSYQVPTVDRSRQTPASTHQPSDRPPPPHPPPPKQSEISPGRREQKNWPLQHTATRLLREMLGVLDLAERAGTDDDRNAADRLARRCVRGGLLSAGGEHRERAVERGKGGSGKEKSEAVQPASFAT